MTVTRIEPCYINGATTILRLPVFILGIRWNLRGAGVDNVFLAFQWL